MRSRPIVPVLLCLVVLIASLAAGCSWLSGGPSDEEVVAAVQKSPTFTGGVKGFTLKSPIVVVRKSGKTKGGYWVAKVKFTLTYTKGDGTVSVPVETASDFRLYRTEDAAGKAVWRAELGT